MFEDLTINDLSALRYVVLNESASQSGLTVRKRHFERDELEEMVTQTIPAAVHFYFQSRALSRGPSAEEIFIIDDVYSSQARDNFSDRFDEETLNRFGIGSRVHFFKQPFTPAREFIELVTEQYLFMPLPERLRISLYFQAVMEAAKKMERTAELEGYVQKVLRKTADLHVKLETQYIGIRLSDAYLKRGSVDEVRKLQELLGFDLKGYKPIRNVDAIDMFHKYGQVIKDGILGIRSVQSAYRGCNVTEFGQWVFEEWSKVAEEMKRDNPLLRNR